MKKVWWLWAGCLFWVALTVQAALVPNLYDARVPIAQQSPKAQQQASREALRQVLVKVRGNRDILESQPIRNKLTSAESFISQYRFDTLEGQSYFVATFDNQRIDELIRSAGFPIWGSRRPSSLIWLAVENPENGERNIVSEQSLSPYRQQVLATAEARGIAVNLPLMDIDDVVRVGVYDVWGRFIDSMVDASSRYQVESVVLARVYPRRAEVPAQEEEMLAEAQEAQELGWQLDWNFALGAERDSGSLQGLSAEALLQDFIDLHADNLSARYAIHNDVEQQGNIVYLQFNNINDLSLYAQVSKLLSSLSVVSQVSLEQQNNSTSIFAVRLLGTEQDLLNAISLERHFQRQLDEFGQPVESLQFNWVP
ncbi:DUF2066 domain-containing protein [Bowmanella sp. Y26]|uniref:DUF2066 domain-containing protein n=1 Tax=Bowmanella yangjiangensis TaxID=2811230 RepID=UPI001BDBDC45|nr:DUF2066 domain-containing protein [Bowmanella yangjiangensis]MBT1065152.1 DUF2066 domain-containing protein [Bowmanella yangjiangensis]